MRVLLVTGQLAEQTVRQNGKSADVRTEVLTLKGTVAALFSPRGIAAELKDAPLKIKDFDVILVPGLVRGDTKIIAETVGVPTFKGPRYAADLQTVLESLNTVKLSTVTPASDLLKEKLQQKALLELEKVEKKRESLLKNPGDILIKDLPVGKDFPMRVLAEIVDAPLLPIEEVQRLAKHYVSVGGDLIDVGMVSGESKPRDVGRLVKAVKKVVDVPLSIDTLDPKEIRAGVEAGVNLVLSADAGNLEAVAPFVKNVHVVVIPTNQREGYFPKDAQERVRFLEEIIAEAKKLGVTKILADLILEPSNVLESMIAYRDFAKRNPEIPLFVGVSNVTELMDADSVGINALLARMSSEINASLLLATEKSDKAKGTIREEAIAAKMMFLAERRGSVPKDLGIDLLLLKDKRNREEPYDRLLEKGTPIISTRGEAIQTESDSKGLFRIILDRTEETIVALHYASPNANKPAHILKGKTAENILAKVAEMQLFSRLDHAGYLGSELAKAEIALRTGKEYIQDSEMFV